MKAQLCALCLIGSEDGPPKCERLECPGRVRAERVAKFFGSTMETREALQFGREIRERFNNM